MRVATREGADGRAWQVARSVAVQSVGLVGFGAFIEGIRLVYEPAALIVGGALAVVWTMLKMRREE